MTVNIQMIPCGSYQANAYLVALEAREDCVLVGDMVADSELAQLLGTHCVLVPWGHNSAQRLKRTGRQVAGSFEELEAILLGL